MSFTVFTALLSLVSADVLSIPFTRQTKTVASDSPLGGLVSRSTLPLSLKFEQSFYQADITIGTPPQAISVDIDTGSSDLWVYGPDSGFAPFLSSQSSSYENLNSTFSISYGDGTKINGVWGDDIVGVGSAQLHGLQFAVSEGKAQNGLDVGILGIGQTTLEEDGRSYPNFPALLKQQGFISQNAYSLYLNPAESESGVVLFGGVDTAKILGHLAVLPITLSYRLTVNAAVLGHPIQNALLDSGTTFTYFTDEAVIDTIAKYFGATYDNNLGLYVVSSLPWKALPYTFGSGASAVAIMVPSSDVFTSVQDLFYNPPAGDNRYGMTIFKQDGNLNILGDSFLRSAYVVFDMDSNQIAIGQSRATHQTNIVPLTGGPIPANPGNSIFG